jgi:hypothetical protein
MYEELLLAIVKEEPHRGENAECVFCYEGGCGCGHHKLNCLWMKAALLLDIDIAVCGDCKEPELIDGKMQREEKRLYFCSVCACYKYRQHNCVPWTRPSLRGK